MTTLTSRRLTVARLACMAGLAGLVVATALPAESIGRLGARGGGVRAAPRGGMAPSSIHPQGGGIRGGAGNGDIRTGARGNGSGNRNNNNGHNYVNNSHNINNINVNADNHWDNGGWGYEHPVAAGVAFGTAAAVTAAAIGSMAYSLPPSGCVTTYYGGGSYYHCGSVWYQPQYVGTSVTYVVVAEPH